MNIDRNPYPPEEPDSFVKDLCGFTVLIMFIFCTFVFFGSF